MSSTEPKFAVLLLLAFALSACSSDKPATTSPSHPHPPPGMPQDFCALPGAIVFDSAGKHVVPGADASAASLGWVTLPSGFCLHHFANIPVSRSIRFAPGGELFVASPSQSTAGGGFGGLGAIAVLPDDDRDGVADAPVTYLKVGATQGMLFAQNSFYYQDDTKIWRADYKSGERTQAGATELVADITIYRSASHWPKMIDMADDGTLYVSNGGDQMEACKQPYPFEGGILKLDGTPGGNPIVKGLRNPMHIRCQHGHNQCFAVELARDLSQDQGGREKLFPIHEGDDWGHPCCATKDQPFTDITPPPDCSGVAAETNAFLIGNTPFGFDFAPSAWPAPFADSILLALHGTFASWAGATVVAIGTDTSTGLPMKSSTVDGGLSGAISVFAKGWDDGMRDHGRPADVTFSTDGRMFVANDQDGEIFWVAPVTQ